MASVLELPGKLLAAKGWTSQASQATWALLGVAIVVTMLRTIGQSDSFQEGDFGAYYRAACAVSRGESPYKVDEHGPEMTFVYSPAFAYLFRSLSWLDYMWAARVWMLLNWALWVVCVHLALRLALGHGRRDRVIWGMVWLAAFPTASYFWNNVRGGQAATLMMVCCLGWAVCQRRGRPVWSGLLLAAAMAVKLAPGILMPYLILRRDWRGLAGVLVGGLILLALPALWVGWAGSIRLHLEWIPHCQQTQTYLQTCRIENQSLLGALARLPAISNGDFCYSLSNLRLLERAYPLVLLVLAAAFYAWISWTRGRKFGRFLPEEKWSRDNLHLSLLFIFMTVAHPRAWSYNYVALILPCMLLADRVSRRALGWQIAVVSLALIALVCACPKGNRCEPDWSWPRWFYRAKDIWGALVLAGVVTWSHFRQPRVQQGAVDAEPWQIPFVPEERLARAA